MNRLSDACQMFSLPTEEKIGKNDTVTLRYSLNRFSQSGAGVGQLNVPDHAYHQTNWENSLQISDSHTVNARLLTLSEDDEHPSK